MIIMLFMSEGPISNNKANRNFMFDLFFLYYIAFVVFVIIIGLWSRYYTNKQLYNYYWACSVKQ